eukprot:12844682-Ditylum_brightwellii.AAC.1
MDLLNKNQTQKNTDLAIDQCWIYSNIFMQLMVMLDQVNTPKMRKNANSNCTTSSNSAII